MIHIIDLKFMGVGEAIASFLVETSEGPVIVETGPYSTFPTLKKGIERIGYKVSDVKHVFLTHIHLDHAGSAWAFAREGATVYMHPFGERHMADPSKLLSSARRIYKDQMETLWGTLEPIPKDQIVVVKHGEAFTIGNTTFKSWFTPGHAVHHIAWQMGNVLFAGDVAGVAINGGMVVAPCPPPDINIEDWIDSLNLIRTLDLQKIYIAHFGLIENVESHIDELEKLLNDWKVWMKPYFDAQTPLGEIIPKFDAYVLETLQQSGMNEADIAKYNASNPPYMSVAGLMRYWKKKTQ